MSSSMHVDNKGKNILVLGERIAEGLDDTILTAEAKYTINFTQSEKRFVLSLIYYGSKISYLLILQKHINSKQKAQK